MLRCIYQTVRPIKHITVIEQIQLFEPIKKVVHFSDQVTVYEYETVTPCLQEYFVNCAESKRIHLQQNYLAKHGTLVGFDFDKECYLSDMEDLMFIEKIDKSKN